MTQTISLTDDVGDSGQAKQIIYFMRTLMCIIIARHSKNVNKCYILYDKPTQLMIKYQVFYMTIIYPIKIIYNCY